MKNEKERAAVGFVSTQGKNRRIKHRAGMDVPKNGGPARECAAAAFQAA